MKKNTLLLQVILLLALLLPSLTYGQSKVAITIDDVPNTLKYEKDNFESKLLSKLDSIDIPVTIFVNTGLLYKSDSVVRNFELLNSWIKRSYTTIGNHTFGHPKYSELGIDSFKMDVERSDTILKKLAQKYDKSIRYFRFPYNDLGKDSIQHVNMKRYISSKIYIIAPFTVESEDWMFSYIYEYYLNKKDSVKATEIAKMYISKTIEYFDFFDSLAIKIYGRPINQIYLCHDNTLNADYLTVLLNELKKKKYTFVNLDEALLDSIYNQEDKYYKKWGISWLYRWMKNQKEIDSYTKQEPYDDTYKLYEQLVKKQNKQ